MKLTKKLVYYTLYGILIFVLFLIVLLLVDMVRRTKTIKRKYNQIQNQVPIIHDVYIINLDKSKDRWTKLQPQLKKLKPIPCIRWSATDGRKLSEDQMLNLGIPFNMLPSDPSVKESNKEARKGEIGCYQSHKQLLEYLNTLEVHPDAGHLILEDDAVIEDTFLSVWNEKAQYVPKDWGLFYFGLRENAELGRPKHGIAKLKKTWGTYGYMVKHSRIPEILRTITPMTGPIDAILQENYKKLNAYAYVKPNIFQNGASTSTIWDGT